MVDHLLSGGNKAKKKNEKYYNRKNKLATKNVQCRKKGKCKKKMKKKIYNNRRKCHTSRKNFCIYNMKFFFCLDRRIDDIRVKQRGQFMFPHSK